MLMQLLGIGQSAVDTEETAKRPVRPRFRIGRTADGTQGGQSL